MLGAPFYVMELVDGMPYRTRGRSWSHAGSGAHPRDRRTRLVDTLADLHAVDPPQSGWPTSAGRRASSPARCAAGASSWTRRAAARSPGSTSCATRLAERMPRRRGRAPWSTATTGSTTSSSTPDDGSARCVDWEMATLGDPLTDVALLLTYQRIAALGVGAGVSDRLRRPASRRREDSCSGMRRAPAATSVTSASTRRWPASSSR